jgi:hypothetical protein
MSENAGQLNFRFFCLCLDYWKSKPNYQGINDILGALEGCKQEFYRRIVGPYEDEAIQRNGDVL